MSRKQCIDRIQPGYVLTACFDKSIGHVVAAYKSYGIPNTKIVSLTVRLITTVNFTGSPPSLKFVGSFDDGEDDDEYLFPSEIISIKKKQ